MELLKKIFKFEDFHKPIRSGFGKSHLAEARASRAHERRLSRQEKRHTILLNRRRISIMDTTLENTKSPAKITCKTTTNLSVKDVPKKVDVKQTVKDKRLEELKKWRLKKEKEAKVKKEEKKPIFKPGGTIAKFNYSNNAVPLFTFTATKLLTQKIPAKESITKVVNKIIPDFSKNIRVTRSQNINTTLNATKSTMSTATLTTKVPETKPVLTKKMNIKPKKNITVIKNKSLKRKSINIKENVKNQEIADFLSPNMEIRKKPRSILTEKDENLTQESEKNVENLRTDDENSVKETRSNRRISRIKTRSYVTEKQKETEDITNRQNSKLRDNKTQNNINKNNKFGNKMNSRKIIVKNQKISTVNKENSTKIIPTRSKNISKSIDNTLNPSNKSAKTSRKSIGKNQVSKNVFFSDSEENILQTIPKKLVNSTNSVSVKQVSISNQKSAQKGRKSTINSLPSDNIPELSQKSAQKGQKSMTISLSSDDVPELVQNESHSTISSISSDDVTELTKKIAPMCRKSMINSASGDDIPELVQNSTQKGRKSTINNVLSDDVPEITKKSAQKGRKSIINSVSSDDMSELVQNSTQKGRKSTINNVLSDDVPEITKKSAQKGRKSIINSVSSDDMSELVQNSTQKGRKTTINNVLSDDVPEITKKSAQKGRKSMIYSVSSDDIPELVQNSIKKGRKSAINSVLSDVVSESTKKIAQKGRKSMINSVPTDDVPELVQKSTRKGRKSMINNVPSEIIPKITDKTAQKGRKSMIDELSSDDVTELNQKSTRKGRKSIINNIISDEVPELTQKSTEKERKSMNINVQRSIFLNGDMQTPPKDQLPNIYISPFVTTSRGKGSARRENKVRQSLGIDTFSENTPEKANKAACIYFHNILDNIIDRLNNQCEIWKAYKKDTELTSDVCDMIDVATGQTQLLINKKFQQFRNLVNNCQNGDGEGKVMAEDLQGFWDMVYIQVNDLDLRFNGLEQMKKNNWADILPVPKKVAPVKKRAPVKPKAPAAKSNIREAIRAARMKSNKLTVPSNEDVVFNGGFFIVKSPNRKSMDSGRTPNKRKSLLAAVLSTEAKKHIRKSSSGLTMIKLSKTLKSVGKENNNLNQTMPTPGRSILKKSNIVKNVHNISKVVLFKDEDSDSD